MAFAPGYTLEALDVLSKRKEESTTSLRYFSTHMPSDVWAWLDEGLGFANL